MAWMQGDRAGRLPSGQPFAGRYELGEELGRGGVARVCRAIDLHRSRVVALKYLRANQLSGAHARQVVTAFEEEFAVLDELQHPRIVRVFDCGVAEETPYYTMELLEGEALERRLPLSLREVSSVLRDVASCLALLHARGYVHRDVTTLNVWCERDGRVKLLDFGAMARFGERITTLIGTPPYTAPESLRGEPLDGRSDLFAFGALAYRALGGRHAFDAKTFHDLPAAWKNGPDPLPAELGVPPSLAGLIMELLSPDPAGRPATASEVMERVCAALAIQPDTDLGSARAYLMTPPLLGRDTVFARTADALSALESSRGAALLLTGSAQMGHSRLLHRVTRKAAMQGVTHLSVHCGFTQGDPLGIARALCNEALAHLPAPALELARPHASLLAHLSEGVCERLGVSAPPPLADRGTPARVTQALHAWLCDASEQHPLLIAVDDAHHCDGPALGLLSRLARATSDRKLLMLMAVHGDVAPRVRNAVEWLAADCESLELRPLEAMEVEQLTSALFWGAEHRRAVATWLHHASGGAPGTCVALAEHLLDTGLARYDAGRWHLPADPQQEGLPTGLRDVLERRIATLGEPARRLAQALALANDDTRPDFQPKLHLDLAELSRLLDPSGSRVNAFEETARHLAELIAAGMVRQIGQRSVIAHRAMAEILRASLSREQASDLHGVLAHVLAERQGETLSAVRHLQLAGMHADALALIDARAPQLRGGDFHEMRLSLAAECFDSAIEYARASGQPRELIDKLFNKLTPVLAVFDWSRAHLLEEELNRQHEALVRGDAAEATPQQRIRRIAAQAGALTFACARAHDAERLRHMIGVLESLQGESPSADHHCAVARQGLDMVRGREVTQELLPMVVGYYALPDMPEQMRRAAGGVHGHAMGVWLAERGMRSAIETADAFEAAVPGIWQAAHVHWLAHGFRCDGAQLRKWEPRATSVAPDDLWRRRGFLMAEARMHSLLGDLLALKAVLGELDAVAEDFAGWRPWRDWARGEQALLCGSLEEARVAFESALEAGPAGEHAAFCHASPGLARVESRAGGHDAAIARARDGLQKCERLRLSHVGALDHQLVLAESLSQRGDHDEAARVLDEARQLAARAQLGGIHLGRILETSAACSLRRGDRAHAAADLRQLAPLFEASGIPALHARYLRLNALDPVDSPRATVRRRSIPPPAG